MPKVQVEKSLDQDKIKKIADLLRGAKSVLFITGAGIPIEMALAGETLETKPHITWKYLARIEEKCRGAKPNHAHEIIKEMEKHFERVCVFTQNIDGLHHKAGSKNIIDIHGDMYKLICPHCMWRGRIKDYSEIKIPPVCPECNKIVRPQVVFFGEILPYDKCQVLLEELEKGFDVYFSIGTTSVFHYISQPMVDARANGRPTIEINPDQTHISDIVDIKLPLGAAEAMGKIWKELQNGDQI